jgi:hypothetical protein
VVNNSDIQKFLVQTILLHTSDSSLLPDTTEVREDNWHGKTYSYPNIRVRVERQEIESGNCNYSNAYAVILVNSEEPSSDQCNDIAFSVAEYLHEKTISDSIVNNDSIKSIKISVSTLGGAESVGEIWLVRIQLRLLVTSK